MKGLILTYLVCYGGCLVALFRPWIGFLIFVSFAILRPEALYIWSFAGEGGRGFSLHLALALMAGWAINGMGNFKFGQARAIVLMFAGYLFWCILSATQAQVDKEIATEQVISYAKVFIPFLIGLSLIDSVKQLKQLAVTIALSHTYLAWEANRQYYENYEFIAEEWVFLYMESNSIAITMVASAGLAVFLALASEKWWQKLFWVFSTALMMHVVMFSLSRGGMVSLGFTALVAFVLIPKRPSIIIGLFGMILIGYRLAGQMIIDRFMTSFAEEKDASAQSRSMLWGNCLQVMDQYPIFGVGPENWFMISDQFGWGKGKAAHTMWLQVGAETGYPGLIFLALFYLICLVRMYKYTRERTPVLDPWIRHLARMVIASLVGFSIAAQFLSVQGVELPFYIVLIGAGILKLQYAAGNVPQMAGQLSGQPTATPWGHPQPAPAPIGSHGYHPPQPYPASYPQPYPYRG